jgi:hypothetical protein
MSGTWPDGLPVHDLTLYVRLSCGHERVSRGWRGNEGEAICCDACKTMQTIVEVSMTDVAPYTWRWAKGRAPEDQPIAIQLSPNEARALLYAHDINEFPVSNPLGDRGEVLLRAAEQKLREALRPFGGEDVED